MEFIIGKNALQKELGFVQSAVEKKNTIPALSSILIESVGENTVRFTGTDLDVTMRCEAEAEISVPGSMCVAARKLFDISRVLPDAPVSFRKEENDWATVKCEHSNFRIAGVESSTFPEIPGLHSAPINLPANLIKNIIDRTIFAITLEESRYTLSGAKFILNDSGIRMVTTDGHRLAYIECLGGKNEAKSELEVLIPRKTLTELNKLAASHEGDIGLGTDENHLYFKVGSRLLISRTLTGQFPNYEMVMPRTNDKTAIIDSSLLGRAIRGSHNGRRSFTRDTLPLTRGACTQFSNRREGEARETVAAEYDGSETEIGFNASYLQDFLNVIEEGSIAFEFKDGNSQAQLKPNTDGDCVYKYVVMPMRL